MLAAQVERIGRVAAEIQQRAAGLIGDDRIGGQAREVIDLAFVIDLALRPSLFQDLNYLA